VTGGARGGGGSNYTGSLSGTASVSLPVAQAPVAGITAPAGASVFQLGNGIAITASASDADGSVVSVDFYDGTTKIGTSTTAPYSFQWNGAAAGQHSLTGVATDNDGLQTLSAAVAVRVNTPPTVTITAPANASVFQPGAAIVLTATAADTDGTVVKVEFYDATTKLGQRRCWKPAGTGASPTICSRRSSRWRRSSWPIRSRRG
jgi:hypothetical protein